MDTLLGIFVVIILVSGMISAPHWLMIKSELKSNGLNTTYLFFLFSDLTKFWTLIKNETNTEKRNNYKSIFYLTVIPTILSMFCFIGIIIVINLY